MLGMNELELNGLTQQFMVTADQIPLFLSRDFNSELVFWDLLTVHCEATAENRSLDVL